MKVQKNNTDHKKILTILVISFLVVGLFSAVSAGKSSRKGYLGVAIERVSNSEKKELGISHGVLVTEVIEDSPAEEAGLQEEDIILTFNGKKIRNADNLVKAVRETEPDTEVRVTILRDKKRQDITVKVGKKRSFSGILWDGDDGYIRVPAVNRGYLGVQMRDLDEDLAGYFGVKAGEGVLVLEVIEDSPAEEAGMKAGDVILSIGGEEVGESQDVYDILHDFDPGEEVEVGVMRHKRKQSFKVELDERDLPSGIRMLRMKRGSSPRLLNEFLIQMPEMEHLDIDIPDIESEILREKNLKHLEERLQRIPERVHKHLEVIKENTWI